MSRRRARAIPIQIEVAQTPGSSRPGFRRKIGGIGHLATPGGFVDGGVLLIGAEVRWLEAHQRFPRVPTREQRHQSPRGVIEPFCDVYLRDQFPLAHPARHRCGRLGGPVKVI